MQSEHKSSTKSFELIEAEVSRLEASPETPRRRWSEAAKEGVEFAIGPAGGDALEGELEPGLRIDVVKFCRRQQRGKGRPSSSAAVRPGEERIFAGDGLRADGPLDGIVVDVDPAVMKEALEIGAASSSVSDRVG